MSICFEICFVFPFLSHIYIYIHVSIQHMLQPGVQEEVKNLHATMEKHLSRQELLMEAPELRRLVNWMCGVVTIPNHCFREIDDRYLEMSGLKLAGPIS